MPTTAGDQSRLSWYKVSDNPIDLFDPDTLKLCLTDNPRSIPPSYIYDSLGSRLFEHHCEQKEYYIYRAEYSLLLDHAADMVRLTEGNTIVELGAGNCRKSDILVKALAERKPLVRYVAIDIDSEVLERALPGLTQSTRNVDAVGLIGSFLDDRTYDKVDGRRRVLALLGGTIGNMSIAERLDLIRTVSRRMTDGELFLVGADLLKPIDTIRAAYNDKAGFGAATSLNALNHLNWRFGADFKTEYYKYEAEFDTKTNEILVNLRSITDQTVNVRGLALDLDLREGEPIFLERMKKFTEEEVASEFESEQLSLKAKWIHREFQYGLFAFAKSKSRALKRE